MKSPIIESLRGAIRVRGYSMVTEKTYIHWTKKYIRFIDRKHPAEVPVSEIARFLTWLAKDCHCSAGTQKVALNALVFLYQKYLKREVGDLGFTPGVRRRYLPTVLDATEVRAILGQLSGRKKLIIALLYGSGLRVNECLSLRVQDIDLKHLALTIHDGKGRKDRRTILSPSLVLQLQHAINAAVTLQEQDNAKGVGCALPSALARKYPSAWKSPAWAWIFPSSGWCNHPDDGTLCLYHLHDTVVRRFLKKAVLDAGITAKRINCHTFRHFFATAMLAAGTDIRTVQELPGHSNVKTTQIYTHVLGEHFAGTRSPLDQLMEQPAGYRVNQSLPRYALSLGG